MSEQKLEKIVIQLQKINDNLYELVSSMRQANDMKKVIDLRKDISSSPEVVEEKFDINKYKVGFTKRIERKSFQSGDFVQFKVEVFNNENNTKENISEEKLFTGIIVSANEISALIWFKINKELEEREIPLNQLKNLSYQPNHLVTELVRQLKTFETKRIYGSDTE
jgi:hypothetical protein